MIREAIQHLLTPANKEIKALGYLRETIAIGARYKRCRAAWAGHLEKCHHHILEAATELKEDATIMIIGSGALHDVPIDKLEQRGHKILLVDIVHPAKMRRKYKRNDQIIFFEHDVTGLIKPIFDRREFSASRDVARDIARGVERGVERDIKSLPSSDLIISLNILSQLPINLMKYAAWKKLPLPPNFENTLMRDHLALLQGHAPRQLIISDVERQYWDNGTIIDTEPALPKEIRQNLKSPLDIWDWHIAPKGELGKHISLLHKVACYQIKTVSDITASES